MFETLNLVHFETDFEPKWGQMRPMGQNQPKNGQNLNAETNLFGIKDAANILRLAFQGIDDRIEKKSKSKP